MGSNVQPGYSIYPRGFLGAQHRDQIEHRKENPFSVNGGKFVFSEDKLGAALQPNHNVVLLYEQYLRNEVSKHKGNFYKQVLQTAVNAFGTKNFMEWYMAQFTSPGITDMHLRFLTDTLRFIYTGRREMSVETWAALVKLTDGTSNIESISSSVNYIERYMHSNEIVSEFFHVTRLGNELRGTTNTNVAEVIQTWCSNPSGFGDMLCTLRILFGKV